MSQKRYIPRMANLASHDAITPLQARVLCLGSRWSSLTRPIRHVPHWSRHALSWWRATIPWVSYHDSMTPWSCVSLTFFHDLLLGSDESSQDLGQRSYKLSQIATLGKVALKLIITRMQPKS